jgi:cytochrome b
MAEVVVGANAETEAGRDMRPAEVRVWDPLVRIFHWSLVIGFAVAFVSGDEWDKLHIQVGYAIAGLIAFRLIWGFIGPKHARFSDFVTRPSRVLAYLRDTVALRARRYIGHNPAGGAMVVALLVMIAAICGTGYMMTTDAFWGVEWVEEVHEAAANLTLALIAVHVLGVIVASFEHRENLVRAMVTGRKRA